MHLNCIINEGRNSKYSKLISNYNVTVKSNGNQFIFWDIAIVSEFIILSIHKTQPHLTTITAFREYVYSFWVRFNVYALRIRRKIRSLLQIVMKIISLKQDNILKRPGLRLRAYFNYVSTYLSNRYFSNYVSHACNEVVNLCRTYYS